MTSASVASRSLGALASRAAAASVRRSSTLARASAASLASSGAAHGPRPHLPPPLPAAAISLHGHRAAPARPPSPSSRSFSAAMMPRRGFPQYTVFGPDVALSLRASMPAFKRAGTDGVSVERRGKLVVEFVPRNNDGAGFAWQSKTVFSLSVEEVGLLLSRLPENSVELSHKLYGAEAGDGAGDVSGVDQLAGDVVEKVLTVDPAEGAAATFKLDYMAGGVGGQTPPGLVDTPPTPLEVTLQAGEVEVLKSICQSSLPYLLGWNTTMDIASAAAISKGLSGGGGHMY